MIKFRIRNIKDSIAGQLSNIKDVIDYMEGNWSEN